MGQFIAKQPYTAEILDHGILTSSGRPDAVKVVFRLLGKVSDWSDLPSAEPLDGVFEYSCLLGLPYDDAKTLAWRLNDLRQMGMEGYDPYVLDAGHEEYQSLVGKYIVVAPTYKNRVGKDGKEEEVEYWNPVAKRKNVEPMDAKTRGQSEKRLSRAKEEAIKILMDREAAEQRMAQAPSSDNDPPVTPPAKAAKPAKPAKPGKAAATTTDGEDEFGDRF